MSSPLGRLRALVTRRSAPATPGSGKGKRAFTLFRRPPVPVGIDIGPQRVRVVALASVEANAAVTHAFEFSLAPGIFKGEDIAQPEQLVLQLQEEFRRHKLPTARAVLGVSGGSVIVKRFAMPRMDAREALRHVPAALKLSQGDTDQMMLDLAVLEGGDAKQMQAIAVAARRERVRVRQLVALEVGLEVEAIDVDSFALFNAFAATQGEQLDTRPTLVHIGDESTVIVVADALGPLVARTLDTGFGTLLDQVMQASSAPPEQALKFLFSTTSPISMYAETFQQWTRPLVDAVRRVGAAVPKAEGVVSEVYLSGGAARIEGLAELLSQQTGQPVRRFDPLATLPRALSVKDVDGASYALALGLAMRQVS